MHRVIVFGDKNKESEEVKNYFIERKIPFKYVDVGVDISEDEAVLHIGRVFNKLPIILVDGVEITFSRVKAIIENVDNEKTSTT